MSKVLGMRVSPDKDGSYVLDQEEANQDLLRVHELVKKLDAFDYCSRLLRGAGRSQRASLDDERGWKPSIMDSQSLVGSLLWVARCMRLDG